MQVRCICNDGAGILTLGRIYTVKREKCEFYYLQEFGTEEGLGWFKERFEVVPEKPNDLFTGKTILRVNSRSVNVKKFYFTDGTGVELWAECGSDSFAIPSFEVKKFTYKLRPCGRIGKVTYHP